VFTSNSSTSKPTHSANLRPLLPSQSLDEVEEEDDIISHHLGGGSQGMQGDQFLMGISAEDSKFVV
jgi:hypothetical protein